MYTSKMLIHGFRNTIIFEKRESSYLN